MHIIRAMAFAMITTAILAGCASTGNQALKSESETTVQQKLSLGKSTQDDVKALFGAPMSTSFTDGGAEIWHYEFTYMKDDAISYVPIVNLFAKSATGTKKDLTVLFDSAKVVQRYSLTEADVKSKFGLMN